MNFFEDPTPGPTPGKTRVHIGPTQLLVYYAHCMSIYNTPQEDRDILTLEDLGWEVLNPNTPEVQENVDLLNAEGHSKLTVMELVFRPMCVKCDVLAFRALPDGSISSGVVREIEWAGFKPVIELPASIKRRSLSLDYTREYLREVGQR